MLVLTCGMSNWFVWTTIIQTWDTGMSSCVSLQCNAIILLTTAVYLTSGFSSTLLIRTVWPYRVDWLWWLLWVYSEIINTNNNCIIRAINFFFYFFFFYLIQWSVYSDPCERGSQVRALLMLSFSFIPVVTNNNPFIIWCALTYPFPSDVGCHHYCCSTVYQSILALSSSIFSKSHIHFCRKLHNEKWNPLILDVRAQQVH